MLTVPEAAGLGRSQLRNHYRAFWLVGVAGFEPATTRTPSVNAGFSTVILLTAQYAPSSSLSVGICSFNPDISAYWRTRNSSESPHKSLHGHRRANNNATLDFCSPSCLAPPRGYIWRKTRTNDRTPSLSGFHAALWNVARNAMAKRISVPASAAARSALATGQMLSAIAVAARLNIPPTRHRSNVPDR